MKLDNRLKKTMVMSVTIISAIFIIVIIIALINNKTLSYSKLEEKIKNAAIKYYNDNPSILPVLEENEVKVDVATLVEGRYLKPLEKYLKKGEDCTAEVYATLKENEYIYTPYLNCTNYSTETLYSRITNNEELINDVSAGKDGLYVYENALIYRGEHVNNYVSFAGQLWRILRIDGDHNFRLLQVEPINQMVWDNRYNVDTKINSGYNNFEKSRMKETFEAIYNDQYGKIFSEADKLYMIKKNLCLDTKNNTSFSNNGVIECNVMSEEKYLFSLLDMSEYFVASTDLNCNSFNNPSCRNYNYLNIYGSYWSMNAYSGNSYQAYYISSGAQLTDVNEKEDVRLIITLSKHVLYNSGDGSQKNPYIIK